MLQGPLEPKEYTSGTFRDMCTQLGLRQSASRTGSCLDNAVAESFFATLKVEHVHRHYYPTRREARTSIFAWLHTYNTRRLHSTLGYTTPVEWEHRQAMTDPLPSTTAA